MSTRRKFIPEIRAHIIRAVPAAAGASIVTISDSIKDWETGREPISLLDKTVFAICETISDDLDASPPASREPGVVDPLPIPPSDPQYNIGTILRHKQLRTRFAIYDVHHNDRGPQETLFYLRRLRGGGVLSGPSLARDRDQLDRLYQVI